MQDHACKITFVGRDEDGRTVVRVKSGAASSVVTLQRALNRLMPYARVRTSEDVLDGSVQAQIVVPTSEDEWAAAEKAESTRLLYKMLSACSFAMFAVGVGIWISSSAINGDS